MRVLTGVTVLMLQLVNQLNIMQVEEGALPEVFFLHILSMDIYHIQGLLKDDIMLIYIIIGLSMIYYLNAILIQILKV